MLPHICYRHPLSQNEQIHPMKRIALTIISLYTLFLTTYADKIDSYNVIWDSPSANSLESMPCGGGDAGMNVWVENGELMVYLSRSGTFDELNSFPKLGRIRISLTPNPFEDYDSFRQELKLKDGYVEIAGTKNGLKENVDIWADIFLPVAHIDIRSNKDIMATATYETWRFEDRALTMPETEVCRTYKDAPVEAIVKSDTVRFKDRSVLFYHHNSGISAFDIAVEQQKLGAVKSRLWNPIDSLTFGGRLFAKNMKPAGTTEGMYAATKYRGWMLSSKRPACNTTHG